MYKENRGPDILLFSSVGAERRLRIENNRQIVTRLIEAIKIIGKHGLGYRGNGCNEAVYTLFNDSVDHGHFFSEIVGLVSEFELLLRT
ncbi:hypothetical protein NPIL_181371 [Nephila pilipes]|uniref:Uncharacterized protein n=1 Tax=Nephila pilipes TaxID=299642 RepID=A0A8X6PYX9_NEPPI|nr:hypothetical protein NPIL_181371 [Nephila pilipes]